MYDEKDIREILKRARELEQKGSGTGASGQLSLSEIEEIARESGMSPEYVRQAAHEYEGVSVEEPFFLDTGSKYEIEILGFAKGEPDQKTWAELRSIIEYEFETPGKVSRRSDGIKWKADPSGFFRFLQSRKSLSVEVNSSGNRVALRIRQNLKTYHKILYPGYAMLVIAIGLLTLGLFQSATEGVLLAGLFAGVSQLFFYWVKNLKSNARGRLKETMEELQSVITRRFAVRQPGKKAGDMPIEFENLHETGPEGESGEKASKTVEREKER